MLNTTKPQPVTRAPRLEAVIIAAIIVAIVVSSLNRAEPQALPTVAPSDAGELLRENPHLLSDVAPQDADAVLVEFVDFQCPACATASPIVQQVADEYGDRLAVVVRNLPLTSIHPHAVEAAVAAEAAAAQGEFAAMYKELFATHQEWSSARGDQSDTFRDLAEQLGLDMDEYDRVADDRVAYDRRQTILLSAEDVGLMGLKAHEYQKAKRVNFVFSGTCDRPGVLYVILVYNNRGLYLTGVQQSVVRL